MESSLSFDDSIIHQKYICVIYLIYFILGGIAPKANKLEQAKQLLRELAETSNAISSNEVFDMAEEQGLSKRTLENAKKELGIRAKKINNSWYWELDRIKPE
jgi:hypothetical protein